MQSNIERQRNHFDSIAETYYRSRRHANHLLFKDLMWKELFKDWNIGDGPGLDVLEAMCGFAEGKTILENGLRQAVRYSGFDYSQAVISRLNSMSPELDVACADVTEFEPSRMYDIVILLGGLHHVPDHAADVVMRLSKAIRPGGYFINLEPTHGNPVFRFAREGIYRRNAIFDEQTERAFDVDTLFSFFGNAGLSMFRCIYPGLSSYVLYYNPDAFPLLNVGGERCVRSIFAFDRCFFRTAIGRALSFATLTAWKKD